MSAPITSLPQAQALYAELQQRASTLGVVLRAPPPAPTTCCGRGCNGCVWEGYFSAAEYWCEEAWGLLAAGGVAGGVADSAAGSLPTVRPDTPSA